MANRKVIFDIEAENKTGKAFKESTGQLDKFKQGFQQLTGMSLLSAGAMAAVSGAITKVISYTKEAIAKNDAYITSIVDMARFTGDQTDAMSRLVQVADDVFLSQEALNNAMSIGAKKGLDMSIEGILKLADTYNALGTVQEKNKLLNDNFGRSGLAVGKLLEMGSDGIRKNMQAVSDSLVVTKQSVETAYAYKQSLDAVNDSLDGMANVVSQGTMPALTEFNREMADFIDSVNESGVVTKALAGALDIATKALRFWDGVLSNDLSKWWPAKEGAKEFTKALREMPGAFEAAAISGSNMMSVIASLTTAENTYQTNVEENNAELLTLMEERARLKRLGYTEESQQIRDIDAKLDINAQKAGENADAHELATRRIVLSYAQQLLAADGLTQEEAEFLLQKGVEWGIYSETAVEEMQSVITEAGLVADAINAIPTDHTITITTVYVNSGGGGGADVNTNETQAAGGSGIVPPGFTHDNFLVGMSSGEKYSVTPSSRVGASERGGEGGGNTYNFNVTGVNSPEQFVKRVGELVKQQGGLPQA